MDLLAIYMWVAFISGAIFLLQFVASLFGLGGLDGADGLFDASDSIDAASGFGDALLSYISVRNVVAFLLAFSVTGYFCLRDYGMGAVSTLPAAMAGVAFVALNMFLMRSLSRLQRDTRVQEKELVGHTATVVFTVLAARTGQGKIDVTVDGKIMTLLAITDEPEDLPRNTSVIIETVLEGWICLVHREGTN